MKKMSPSHEDLDIEADIFPASVSVDGTWQKRYGHSSLLGVVFVLAVETGEVLDLEVNLNICFECRSKGNWNKDSQRYKVGLQSIRINVVSTTANHQRQWRRVQQYREI